MSFSVIGGADGPTSVFVAGSVGNGMDTVFIIMFVLIVGIFVVVVVKGVGQWNKNSHSPRLEVEALVCGKRQDISQTQHTNAGDITGVHGYHTTTSTAYYVTFQVASGDRMEFSVSGEEYGRLTEGDKGKLSFQGTKYLGFEGEKG